MELVESRSSVRSKVCVGQRSIQMNANQNNLKCKLCGSFEFVIDGSSNDRVCMQCGCVGHWVRPNLQTFHESSFTSGPSHDGDTLTRTIHSGPLLNIARRAESFTGGYQIARLNALFGLIEDMTGKLRCATPVTARAKDELRRILKLSKVPRVKKDALICIVAICFAARKVGNPYTFKELERVCAGVKRKEICKTYKAYEQRLGKSPTFDTMNIRFLPRIRSNLGMKFQDERKVAILVREFDGHSSIRSQNPLTKIAVGCVLVNGKDDEFIGRVSAECGVSVHTLNKACNTAASVVHDHIHVHDSWYSAIPKVDEQVDVEHGQITRSNDECSELVLTKQIGTNTSL